MSRVDAGIAAYDALLVLAGFGVLHGFGWATLRRPDPRLVPLALFTGWASTGVVLSLSLLAGFDPSVPHVVLVAGALVLAGLAARRRRAPQPLLRPSAGHIRRLARRLRQAARRPARLAYLAGLSLIAAGAVVLGVARLGASVGSVALAAAALVAAAAAIDRRHLRELARRRPGALAGGLAAAAGGGVLLLAAVAAAIVAFKGEWPSEWDSWSIWIPRAETVFYWHGLDTGVGGWGAIPHPEYPPLLTVMYAACWHFAGGVHPSVLPMQETILAIGFVGGALALLDRLVPRWVSFPSLALLAVTPGFWWRTQTLMADPPLGYLVALAAVASLVWLSTLRGRWLAAAVGLLAAAALTKLEGLSLGLVLALAVAVPALAAHRRRGLPALWLFAGPAAVEPWRLWLARHHLPSSATDYHASELFHPAFLHARLGRLHTALDWLLHSVFRTSQWLVVLPVALAAAALVARRLPATAAAVVSWLGLGYLGLAAVYWIGIPDLDYYLTTSADRVASTLVIVAGTVAPLLIGLALGRGSPRAATVPPDPPAAPG